MGWKTIMYKNHKNFLLEYDTDYGIDKKTGWSVCINGSYTAMFEKYWIIALIKSFYIYWFVWEKDFRN